MEISDTVVRFITMVQRGDSVLPEKYAELPVPEGCLDNGKVVNKQKFVSFFKRLRKAHKISLVNLVLASSQIQTMTLSVAGAAPLYIREALEKEFDLPAKDILYEFHAVGGDTKTTTFQVTAIPKVVSQEFLTCFKSAGIVIASIESVGQGLSRALLPIDMRGTSMIVSIDGDITTVALAVNGVVSQHTMFAFGDNAFTEAISKKLSISNKEAETIKQEQGLLVDSSRKIFDAVIDDCAALVHHINEVYVNWRTAHKALPKLEAVYLTGAGSLLRGLDEYIAAGLRTKVMQANVWANCLSFDEYIPTLSQAEAVRYGAVIGTALATTDAINLLPTSHKKSLQRKHVASATGKIILSFILGAIVGFAAAKIWALPVVHNIAFRQLADLLHKIEARW